MAKSREEMMGGGKSLGGSFNKLRPTAGKLTRGENPLADIEYTGDEQEDDKKEMDALLAAFKKAANNEGSTREAAIDSEFWFAICFQSRAQKDAFLAAVGWYVWGDKYIDGAQVAAALGINLIPGELVNPDKWAAQARTFRNSGQTLMHGTGQEQGIPLDDYLNDDVPDIEDDDTTDYEGEIDPDSV